MALRDIQIAVRYRADGVGDHEHMSNILADAACGQPRHLGVEVARRSALRPRDAEQRGVVVEHRHTARW